MFAHRLKYKQGKAWILLLVSAALLALPAVRANIPMRDPRLRASSSSSAWREFGGATAPGALYTPCASLT